MISFKLLEHPADIGIEANGATLGEAFASAAAGLISIIVDPSTVRPELTRTVTLEADDTEALLVRWLNEIIYLFDAEHFITGSAKIEFLSRTRLVAVFEGEMLSQERHSLRTDVKAATFHQVFVGEREGTCIVRIYLDV